MSFQIHQLTGGRHEAYFSYQEYTRIQKYFQKNKIIGIDHAENLLLCAKACFVVGKYLECLKAIERVRVDQSTKVLYERQALLMKAAYLQKTKNRFKVIQKAYQQFNYYKDKCPGMQLTPNHCQQMLTIKNLALLNIQRSSNASEDKLQIRKQLKTFKNSFNFPGIPFYIVSKAWNDKLNYYLSKNGEHPGPITNFQLINHIFQFEKHVDKEKRYLNTLMFPLIQNEHYFSLSKEHWKCVSKQFGGYAIQRIFVEDPNNHATMSGDNTFRTLISLNKYDILLQWQSCTYWQYSIIPILWKMAGKGQLKKQNKFKQYLMVKLGYAEPSNQRYKYTLLNENEMIINTIGQNKMKNYLLINYDMEEYQMADSPTQGLKGFENLGNTCYMNAALQSLSQIREFSKYFITNRHLKDINMGDHNTEGSKGEVVCAFAQILKRLWFCSKQTPFIVPQQFKQAFSHRFTYFSGYQQQDSQEFLSHLLNCLHDDLNKNSKIQENKMVSSAKNIKQGQDRMMELYNKSNNSVISDNFIGFHSTTIRCKKCSSESYRFQHFLMYEVQLPHGVPMLELYVFPHNKKPETPLKIQIYVDDFNNVEQLLEAVKEQLRIPLDLELYGYIMDEDYTIRQQLKGPQKIQQLYFEFTKNRKKTYYLFLYVLNEIKVNEQLAFVTFYFEKDGNDEVTALPRLIILDQAALEKNNQIKLLKQISQKALPSSGLFQKSRFQQLQSASVKNMKGTSFHTILTVKTIERLRQFSYKSYKRQLGQGVNKVEMNLETCLFKMAENEIIGEDEGWVCKKCGKIREAIKSDRIFSSPQILMFHLKRFTQYNKITTKIQYPVTNFNLSPFVNCKKTSLVYNLVGVILHLGTLNRGHYRANCFNQKNRKWFCFDDSLVKQIDEEQVVDQNAYILIYQRTQSNI